MKGFFILLCWLFFSTSFAQGNKSENIILVTLDGFRWQELFNGADSLLIFDSKYTHDSSSVNLYWHPSPETRREQLMPFLWSVVGNKGQLYGNREYKNVVNCANPYWFSYPGYSEMLTGWVNKKMSSNRKVVNPNPNILEYINQQPAYEKKVAAFSTWEVIPYVIRASTNGIYTNEDAQWSDCDSLKKTNPAPRSDESTFTMAFDYLKSYKPKVMFLSLDGTDHHAHGGRYSEYLDYAHLADSMISELWNWVQSQENYHDKTTLLITTDHGRGRNKSWKTHGRWAFGSNQMWFAVIGPDTPPSGEIKSPGRYYQKQLARTIGSFLELNYDHPVNPIADRIEQMFYPRTTIVVAH